MEYVWITENVSGNQFSLVESTEDHPQGVTLAKRKENKDQFHKQQGQGYYSQEMANNIGTQFQCRRLQEGCRLWVRLFWWIYPTNSMVGKHRQQIWELHVDKLLGPQSFMVQKIRFNHQVITCSHFPSDSIWWMKEVEMVDSVEELKFSRSVCERIFQILRCWTLRYLLLRTRASRSHNSRRRSDSRNRMPRKMSGFQEDDRSMSRSTTIFEWLVHMIQDWITLIFLVLFMTIESRNSIEDGIEFHYQCQRFHPMVSWKVCTRWEYASPCNSTLLES